MDECPPPDIALARNSLRFPFQIPPPTQVQLAERPAERRFTVTGQGTPNTHDV